MHAIGPSPVSFIAPGDLFDHEPKAAASSLSASVTWIGMLTVALTFPLCQRYLKAFMVVPFIVVVIIRIVPFYFYFPETKGQSNLVISNMFQVDNPWRKAIGLKRGQHNHCYNPQNVPIICPTHNNNSYNSIETLSVRTVDTERTLE